MSMFDDVLGLGRTSVIEGTTEYEPEVEEVALEDAQDIPSYMSPMEFMTSVACEQELNMQRLDMAILAEEYIYLRENGQEMVEESAKDTMSGIIAKFKQGINWLWSKIQSFYKTVTEHIKKFLPTDQDFLNKHKGYQAAGQVTIKTAYKAIGYSKLRDTATEYMTKTKDAVEKVSGNLSSYTEKSSYEEEMKKAYASIFSEDIGDKRPAQILAEKYMDSNATEKKFDPKYCRLVLGSEAIKNAIATAKKNYSENKKMINSSYKAAKKMENMNKKAKVLSTDESKAIHVGVKVISKLGKVLTEINNSYIKMLNGERALAKQVVTVAYKQVKKSGADEKKEKANESASLINSVQFGDLW